MFLLIFTCLKLQVHMRSYAVVHTRVNNVGHVIAMTFRSVSVSVHLSFVGMTIGV